MNDLINLKHGCKRARIVHVKLLKYLFSFFIFPQEPGLCMWKFLKYLFSFLIFPQEPGLYITASAFPFQSEPTRWLLCDKPQRIYFLRNTFIPTYIVCLKYASFSLPFLRASIHWSVKQAGMGGGGFKRPVSLLTFDLWSSWLKNYKTRLMFKHWCYIVLC